MSLEERAKAILSLRTVGLDTKAIIRDQMTEIARLQDVKRRSLAIADERAIEAVKLRAALKPFADAVFNDNGDMTITPASFGAYRKAYFVMRGSGDSSCSNKEQP